MKKNILINLKYKHNINADWRERCVCVLKGACMYLCACVTSYRFAWVRAGIWTPASHLSKDLEERTRYQSAKGKLAYSQEQQRSFKFEGYVIRDRCRGNLLRAFVHFTVLTCELAWANPVTLTPLWLPPPFWIPQQPHFSTPTDLSHGTNVTS